MLKKFNRQVSGRRKSELKGTPGEAARDAALNAGIKAAQESAYAIGNSTDKIMEAAEKLNNATAGITQNVGEVASNVKDVADGVTGLAKRIGPAVDRGIELTGGTESGTAFSRIAFKTGKDIARGDKVCTGLCLISGLSEGIAFSCSTVKIIPFRGRIYVGAKIVSRSCMAYRNLCAGEGC